MNAADAVRLLAGLLLATLGAAVLLRRRRDLSAIAFGVFALGLGGLNAMAALGAPGGGVLALAANIVILVGFSTMFLVFPTRLARDEVRILAIALGTGAVVTAPWSVPLVRGAAAAADAVALALAGFDFAAGAAIVAGVVLFPLRARRLPPAQESAARALAIFSVGVALFRGFDADDIILVARGEEAFAVLVHPALVFVLPTVLWVAVAARGAHARLARNTVLAHVGVVIAALVLARFATGGALLGLAGTLLLGFAILRGQIEGLDLKVRFAVSRSSVAAVFVAVFFVASETAQQFFGETIGSQYLGIAAAGALVFAIVPLQRAAERFAEKAVPVSTADGAASGSGKETAYRAALRFALRDRTLTRAEELELAHLADELGIPARRALELRHEVEAATGRP